MSPEHQSIDLLCEHGTAMDVHCCNCHSGFIFDKDHVCPPEAALAARPPQPLGAYRVEVEDGACSRCHNGETWAVVMGDGDDLCVVSPTFHERLDADERCEMLNAAYERGLSAALAARPPQTNKQEDVMEQTTWYGPHACSECGVTIVKAAREQGGASLEPPERLMRIYRRGSESSDVDVVYPMTWTSHVCDPVAVEAWKTRTEPSMESPQAPV